MNIVEPRGIDVGTRTLGDLTLRLRHNPGCSRTQNESALLTASLLHITKIRLLSRINMRRDELTDYAAAEVRPLESLIHRSYTTRELGCRNLDAIQGSQTVYLSCLDLRIRGRILMPPRNAPLLNLVTSFLYLHLRKSTTNRRTSWRRRLVREP